MCTANGGGCPLAFAYLTASLFQRLPLSFRPLTQSCERHMALLAQAIFLTAKGGLLDGSSTLWGGCRCCNHGWHGGFAGAGRDRNPVVARDDGRQQRRHRQARHRLQCVADRLQGDPDLQGQLSRHDERRHRGVPRRQRPAHHAGVRSRHRDHDGRDRRREARLQADGRGRREVRSEDLSARHHRLLLDLEGRDAVVPVQLVVDRHVGQPRRAQEGERRDPEDLARNVRGRQEAARQRSSDLRLLRLLGHLGQSRAALRLAQRAARQQGQRPRRLRHRARVQRPAPGQASREAGRAAEGPRPTTTPAAPTPAKAASPPANARST